MLYRNLENGELCLVSDYDDHFNQMLTAARGASGEIDVDVSLCDFEGKFSESVVYAFHPWHPHDRIWSVLINGGVALELVDAFLAFVPAYFDGSIMERTILDPREKADRRAALMDAGDNIVPIF